MPSFSICLGDATVKSLIQTLSLMDLKPLKPTALVTNNGTTFFATSENMREDFGPIFRLVMGVYDRCGFNSFQVLRRRIHTSVQADELSRSVVKVGAKSCSFGHIFEAPIVEAENSTDVSTSAIADPNSVRLTEMLGLAIKPTEALSLCESLVATIPLEQERFYSSRPVAALLVDPEHRLLGAAVNTNAINRLRHAELNLILNLKLSLTTPLVNGATLYTTLSPCVMCANFLSQVSADKSGLKVVASQLDKGRYGRHNVLANVISNSERSGILR